MIPAILSRQVRQGIRDFLLTTFPVSTPLFRETLPQLLEDEEALFKGPYLSLKRPFRAAADAGQPFTGFEPGFTAHRHQARAFARLNGEAPRSTLIATGTGSGKTESFLFPVLEHCYRNREKGGIKAILIYPMNALANDQARRLARFVHREPRLRGSLRAGLYIGGKGERSNKEMTAENVITDRFRLRDQPPDILLTNYKMLDYLLVRPGDQALWRHNAPETLQYLVVDELHTFDGAQGTDLACLLRRLKQRLKTPAGHLCCVGTSATLGGEKEASRLLDYARDIFGEPFDGQAIINEDLLSSAEFLAGSPIRYREIPDAAGGLLPGEAHTPYAYLADQYRLWFGEEAPAAPEELATALPQKLREHQFLRYLLNILEKGPRPVGEIGAELSLLVPEFGAASPQERAKLLDSFVALISAARINNGQGQLPFLEVRYQLWLRELRRMVVSVAQRPQMAFSDDLDQDALAGHLPVVHCRECGAMGWGALKRQQDTRFSPDLQRFYQSFFAGGPTLHFVFPVQHSEGRGQGICGHCLHHYQGSPQNCPACGKADRLIAAEVFNERRTRNNRVYVDKHCPYCQAHDGLTILGSRAASLISVAISQLFASPFNDDKKLLTFSDSVQDAAHRAGFFGARTFRFNFRAALQQCLQDQEQPPSLAAMPGVFEQYWSRRLDGNAYLSTFFPPDLHYREDYGYLRQHGKLPRGSELPELLRQRLSWEVNSEYGYRARVGRTLEKSGASIALPDPQRLQKALENLLPMLREEIGGLRELDQTALARLIGGFIAQLRVKGGVFHPGLESYIREGANTFMLRRVPYMPPFAPGGRTPVFLSQIPFGYERFDVLLRAGSVTWHSQWAVKNLLPFGQQFDPFMGDIYRLLLRELVAREILQEETVHGVSVWGLRGEALQLTTAVRQLRCDTCGHDMSAATGEDHWVGMPCLRFNCRGHYQAEPSGEDYYRRLYSTGDIQRIFAEEHTGLLGREEREELEQHFEQQNHPWDPNLLSCTPTLEMGVDIGALSSLVLCSVPPRQANYLQRIGRAGRRDGNSFILTVANGDPHDLYFYQQPEEMMAGAVEPPGVFLNAPAVLERQFIAFTFERFILAGVPTPALPAKIRPVLNRWEKEEPGNFPYNWLAFCESSQGILLTDFFNLFQDALDETARKHLSQFVKTDRREGLQSSIKAAFADAAEEIRVHRQRVQQLNRKIREMENSPVRDQNYDANLNELKREKQALNGIINKIADKDLFSFLSEEGLLPNYAFPEPGVQLRSVIYRKKRRADAEGAYQVSVYEYERPGASAIRELAPENQFYAGGRRVSVDQINLQLSPEEFWRFCDNCSHMARDLGGEVSPTCPTCGSERWSDHNQVRSLIRMKQVMANTSDRESRIGDDSDDRSPAHYHNHLVVEIGRDKVASAFHIPGDQVPFGFEYISRFTLREINFGHREQAGNPIRIAGQDTGINGFQVCRACGKVRKAGDAEGRWHAFGCRYRGLTDDDSTLSGFYLYREFQSEALRILAPALLREDSGSVVNSLRAALFLGLREHFRGDIEHLQIAQQFEPYDGPDFQRHYLVLYDRVPGGTGYLKELMRDNYPLLDVLQKGLDKLKACPRCSRADGPDGCYQCIYAYRFSRDMANISRQSAINLLTEILRNRHQVGPIETVDTISLNNLLESELEKRFVDGLARLALEKDNIRLEKEIVNGKHGWRLQVGESVYRMEPQVNLGPEQGVSERCRADFVLYPIKQTPGKPVVLFTDGFAYHAGETQLNRRLGADMRQRMAIVDSKAFRVWSLTWQDLEKLETRHPEHFENLLKSPPHQLFQVYSNQPGRQEHQRLLQLGSMDLLIAHLEKPQAGYWLAVAHLAVLGMVVAEGLVNISKDTYRKALQEAVAAPLDEQKLDVPLAEEGGTLLGCRWVFSGEQEGATVLFMVISQNDDIVTSGGKGIRLLVRLLDEKPMPREKFRRLWNGYLQAFNLLQFLPGARFLASEGLRSAGDPVVDEWLFAEIEPQQDAPQIEPAWAEILAVSEPAWQGAIEQLSGMSVPLPICGYELMNTGGAVCAQAFLAWENDMIAILAPDEMDGKHLFEEAGWQVFAIDALVRDPAMLSGLFK